MVPKKCNCLIKKGEIKMTTYKEYKQGLKEQRERVQAIRNEVSFLRQRRKTRNRPRKNCERRCL